MQHANRHAHHHAHHHAHRHAIPQTAATAPVHTGPAGTAASGGWLRARARASARRSARAAALTAAWCLGLGTLAIDAQATTASRPTPGAYAGRLCVQPLSNAGEAVAPAPSSGAAQGAAPGGDGASASNTPSSPTTAPTTAPTTTAGNCGPVELTLQAGNRASVRFSDIVYRLQLHSSQVDVVLMHGNMQIDGFTTEYDWQGSTLRFNDRDKGLSYRVHFDARPARAGRAPNP